MDHLFIVAYDITDQKRWRKVFKTMKGFGEWVQFSVFQCNLSRQKMLEMEYALREIILEGSDHVLIIDLGPSENIKPRFKSIGKLLEPLEKKAVIV